MLAKHSKPYEVQPHYSLRKLSIGVASVLISTSVYAGLGSKVQAAEVNNLEKTTSEIVENGGQGDAGAEPNKPQEDRAAVSEKPTALAKMGDLTETNHDSSVGAETNTEVSETPSKKEAAKKASDKSVDKANETKQSLNVKKDITPVKEIKDKKVEEEPTIKTVDGAHQETVVGELPDLDTGLLTYDLMNKYSLNSSDPLSNQNASMVWVKKPDVSKVGTSTGTVKLTYTDNNEQKTELINVKVDTVLGEKKGENQVRNRVTYVDADTGEIVRSFSWVGDKGTYAFDQQRTDALGTQAHNTAIWLLGYYAIGDGSSGNLTFSAISEASLLGDKDKNFTILVKKFPNNQPMTWGEAIKYANQHGQSPQIYPFITTSGFNDAEKVKDPASFLANWLWLPEGTQAKWKTEPTFVDPSNPVKVDDHAPAPVIEVDIPGKEPVLITLDSTDPNIANAKDTAADYRNITPESQRGNVPRFRNDFSTPIAEDADQLNATELITDANKLLLAKNILIDERQEASDEAVEKFAEYLFSPKRWSWLIAPDLHKEGWTAAYAQFQPLLGDNTDFPDYVNFSSLLANVETPRYMTTRLRVTPLAKTKTITRRIIVTDPQGNTTVTTQEVAFSGNQTIVGAEPDWGNPTNGSRWAEFIAPTYPGYEPSQAEVEEVFVTPDMSDQTIYITYKPVGQPDIPTPQPDPDPDPIPTPEPKPDPQPDPKPDIIEKPDIDHKQDNKPGDKNHEDQQTIQHKTISNRVNITRTASKRNVGKTNNKTAALPQTGNKSYAVLGLAAIGAVIGLLGLAGLRKRN